MNLKVRGSGSDKDYKNKEVIMIYASILLYGFFFTTMDSKVSPKECPVPKFVYLYPPEMGYDEKIIESLYRICDREYGTCPSKITKKGYRDWDVRCVTHEETSNEFYRLEHPRFERQEEK